MTYLLYFTLDGRVVYREATDTALSQPPHPGASIVTQADYDDWRNRVRIDGVVVEKPADWCSQPGHPPCPACTV